MIYIFFITAIVIVGSFVMAAVSMAPWVPAWKKDLPRIFKLAQIKPGEIFYDLGCGNGRVVFYAAEHYQAQAKGVELALPLYLICQLIQIFKRSQRVRFTFGSLFKIDLSKVDVIYVFGMPDKLKNRLKEKLIAELKPGARVISYVFPIAGLKPVKIDKPKEKDIALYLYTF